MSWSSARHHLPSTSITSSAASTPALPRSARNTLNGSIAYERERANAQHYGRNEGTRDGPPAGKTELDVLRENLRFIRDDSERDASWEGRVAQAYEAKLFKEYAVIDLKHYKSGRIALRWRTAEEVVSSIGEASCASLRCEWHAAPRPGEEDAMPRLTPFELPFAYEEGGQRKSALVKVKLCRRCAGKLMWRDKGRGGGRGDGEGDDAHSKGGSAPSESRDTPGRPRRDRRDRSASPGGQGSRHKHRDR